MVSSVVGLTTVATEFGLEMVEDIYSRYTSHRSHRETPRGGKLLTASTICCNSRFSTLGELR